MELYHALNRGVEKRPLFLDDSDRVRFVHDLYEFNDRKPAGSTYYSFEYLDLRNPDIATRKRDLIVDIHGWCLMDNHYHLLLSERIEGGLTLFLRKLNVGYANYFNEKYRRFGTLFQGRTKKILITANPYFLHILNYVHLNPLDLSGSSKHWRSRNIQDANLALEILERYRWSSYLDYCNNQNFPSLITKELFSDVFKDYKKEISAYLHDIDIAKIQPFLLE